MSKHKIVSKIYKELKKVNEDIDQRILEGRSYRKEARYHRSLLSQLNHVSRSPFMKSLRFISLL
jgi:hypothetical protein